MNKLRIAFVGCGGIAEHYLNVYRDLEWVEMRVCMDTNLERARHAVDRLGTEARATTDFAEALGDDVDVVVINTPNHLHREQALAALAAGKHLLLQKPVAGTLDDAVAIAAAAGQAAERGVISGLYLSYFDQPLMHDLRDMARAGWFGEIAHMSARLMHRGGLQIARQLAAGGENWRASVASVGGGCFIQLAVHYIHLFEWITGARITRVMAMTNNLHCAGIEGEDIACALLEFNSGALGTLEMAWNTAGEQMGIRGTRGAAEYLNNQTLTLESSAGVFQGRVVQYQEAAADTAPGAPGTAAAARQMTVTAPRLDDLRNPGNQHLQFLLAVRDRREPFVSIASGLRDLRVVHAVYESARTGAAVKVTA
ncbi:MAG: Gfo/Idh/MocA family protein [Blastocatellia bacterium]